ncbi:PRC-barrel domain containing protein [Methylobacterium nigriterrae]|uniref:PRC-barrel domain containing protein n=1 Tax=Methylobacterium nigriterrae TaxID=3127512 RepID=UPI0030140824
MRQHVRAWTCALVMLAGEASAQEARSPLVDRADARMQIGAASLIPTLRGRWLYADHKLVVGRVQDVRVSQDGTTLIAVVARRRWLGGGEIGIPVPLLHQLDNDLTVSGTRESIRAMLLLKR